MIDLAELRRLIAAWEVEITTPAYASTDAFHALEDALLDGTSVVLALVEAVEAAQALVAYVPPSGAAMRAGYGHARNELRAALAPFARAASVAEDKRDG